MANDSADVNVKFGGSIEGLQAAMAGASSTVKESSEQIKASLDGIGSAFGALSGVMVAISAVLAGGKFFKEAIDATKEFNSEVKKLALQMGITATEASILDVALESIGVEADQYGAASQKMQRQLRTNEEGLNAMGIATRGQNKEFLNGQELMQNAIDHLKKYKEGTDRNLEAMDIFGPRVGDVNKLIRLNAEVMEEAKLKAESLGLIIGVEGAANAAQYKKAMIEVGEVFKAIQYAIGNALMPLLTALGKQFASSGPNDISILNYALKGLVTTFWIFRNGIETCQDVFIAFYKTLFTMTVALVGFVTTTFSKGLSAGADFFAAQVKKVDDTWLNVKNNFKKNATEMGEAMKQMWSKQGQTPIAKVNDPNATQTWSSKKNGKEDKEHDSAQAAYLKAQEEAKAAIVKDSLKQSMALYDQSYKENLISTQAYFAAKLQISQSEADTEIAKLKKEIEDKKTLLAKNEAKGTPEGDTQALKFKTELVKLESQLGIAQSHRAVLSINNAHEEAKAIEALAKVEKAHAIDIEEKKGNAGVEAEKIAAEEKLALNQITQDQMIELERKFENDKTEIARKAIFDRLELEQNTSRDPKAIMALNAQLEQLEQQHQTALTQINSKATIQRQKPLTDMYKSMETSFQGVIQQFLSGTLTMSNALRGMANAVLSAVTGMLAQLAAKWLVQQAQTLIGAVTTSEAQVAANASVAGAAGVASAAAIPFYGWAIAPEAGAADFAAAMAFSAADGFDIPAGMNPMTQLHSKEMVLPAKHADVIRSMADNGDSGGGDVHLHVNAVDGQSVKKLFAENGAQLVAVLKQQHRNFAMGT